MILHQEKPVSTPGDIALEAAIAGNLQLDSSPVPVAGNIHQRDAIGIVELDPDIADRGLQQVIARPDLAHVSQRDSQADRAMAAHVEDANVIKENHARTGLRVHRWTDQPANPDIPTTRLIDNGRAKAVMVAGKQLTSFG